MFIYFKEEKVSKRHFRFWVHFRVSLVNKWRATWRQKDGFIAFSRV